MSYRSVSELLMERDLIADSRYSGTRRLRCLFNTHRKRRTGPGRVGSNECPEIVVDSRHPESLLRIEPRTVPGIPVLQVHVDAWIRAKNADQLDVAG